MVRPKQLGHLVLRVRDLEVSKKFYTSVLDLKVTYEMPDKMVFMSAGESSHELALMGVGPNEDRLGKSRLGLFRLWE
jgi:catechol 2,3-dioxygenase